MYQITVYCLVYNHEPYLRQTLEGFVTQKTRVQFKVIVHDDASTDGSRGIIEEYASRYPDIISPIFQTENQYSKGVRIFQTFIMPRIDTKYVAVCEGDDYWCDNNKLQLQFEYMESHPDCSFCVHNTKMVDEDDQPIKHHFSVNDQDYSSNDVIAAGGGELFHTSSFFYRFSDRLSMPKELCLPRIGDYPLSIHLSSLGKVHYFGRIMSVSRRGVRGSWTANNTRNVCKQTKHYQEMIEYLGRVEKFFGEKYHKGVSAALVRYRYLLWLTSDHVWKILIDKNTRKMFCSEMRFAKRVETVVKGTIKHIFRKLHLRS